MEWFSDVSTIEWVLIVILVVAITSQLKDILFPKEHPIPVPLVKEKKIVPIQDFTLEELKQYNGTDSKPIYTCVKGIVYDLTSGASFYGPGGSYSLFSGHDSSRCLATVSTSAEDLNQSLDGLTFSELQTLQQWIDLFEPKYPVVGRVMNAPSLKTTSDDEKKNV